MKNWKSLFVVIVLSAIPYLAWDIYFTEKGYWGFNPVYLSGSYMLNLPIEEVLFFVCIPFACVFTHVSILKIKVFKLSGISVKAISILILMISAFLLLLNLSKAYTTWDMIFMLVIQGVAFWRFRELLSHYFITFLFMLIPFIIVNGVLTGFGIEDQVVWYNDAENLGIRFFTIPVEDFFYAYSMILLNLMLFKTLSNNQSLEYPKKP